jgi:hypothetical protein
MTAKTRIKDLEAKMAPSNESCQVVDWDNGKPIECGKMGITLSKDRHECQTCSVPEKNRRRIKLIMVGADGKPVKERDPAREV